MKFLHLVVSVLTILPAPYSFAEKGIFPDDGDEVGSIPSEINSPRSRKEFFPDDGNILGTMPPHKKQARKEIFPDEGDDLGTLPSDIDHSPSKKAKQKQSTNSKDMPI